MFCPQCGQQRVSTETSFCSRCGYLLTGTADLMLTGGLIPSMGSRLPEVKTSPRSRGVRQGVFLFLTSILIVPLLVLLAAGIGMPTPILPILAAILIVGGAILRIAYALLLESSVPSLPYDKRLSEADRTSLNPPQSVPANVYAAPGTGAWRTTNELEPHSVTDGTTRLFEKAAD